MPGSWLVKKSPRGDWVVVKDPLGHGGYATHAMAQQKADAANKKRRENTRRAMLKASKRR